MQSAEKLVLSGFVIAALAGCSMMGMGHGDGGMCGMPPHDSGHGGHESSAPSVSVDEMTANDASVSLKTSGLAAGAETALSVELKNKQTGARISGAKVFFQIKPQNQVFSEHAGHGQEVELQAVTSPEAGIYELKHIFESAGSYEITVRVLLENDDSVTMTVVKNVSPSPDGAGHSDGQSNTSAWIVIGGIGMVIMMAVMFTGGI
ncbi:MAG: FixH family protein [Planctomycetes bacterium]|nr:FixH family protein [Planctomycetota bacterium]